MIPDEYRALQEEKADVYELGYHAGFSAGYEECEADQQASVANLKKPSK